MSEAGVEFPDPTPWSDEELKDMRDPRLEPVNEVIKVLGEIAPLAKPPQPKVDPWTGWPEDNEPEPSIEVGQRLATLHFEICACDALQISFDEAAELLDGLREERDELDKVILGWSQCLAGGVG